MQQIIQFLMKSKALRAYAFIIAALAMVLFTISHYSTLLAYEDAAIILVVIILLLLGYQLLVLDILKKKESSAFDKGLAKDVSTPSGGKAEARIAQKDLVKRWSSAVDELHQAGLKLYDLPWYLMIGEPQSGKSTTIQKAGLEFPAGTDKISGAGGTRSCDWWFTNDAVILDTAGRFAFQEQGAPDASEWKTFLNLLRKRRPRCPINGIIMVIPADSLLKDSPETQEEKANKLRLRLTELQRELGIQFPVFLVITKSDQILGFKEFFFHLQGEDQRKLLGWSMGGPFIQAFDSSQFVKAFDDVYERIHKLRLKILAQDMRVEEIDRLYVFPDEFHSLRESLDRYLKNIFIQSKFLPPLFFRGFYFTSGMQEGRPIASLCKNMFRESGMEINDIADISPSAGNKAFFISDFYRKKLFKETNMVMHFGKSSAVRRRMAIMCYSATVLLVLLTGTFLFFRFRSFNDGLGRILKNMQVMVEQNNEPGSTIDMAENWKILTDFQSAYLREKDKLPGNAREITRDIGMLYFMSGILRPGSADAYLALSENPRTEITTEEPFRDYLTNWRFFRSWNHSVETATPMETLNLELFSADSVNSIVAPGFAMNDSKKPKEADEQDAEVEGQESSPDSIRGYEDSITEVVMAVHERLNDGNPKNELRLDRVFKGAELLPEENTIIRGVLDDALDLKKVDADRIRTFMNNLALNVANYRSKHNSLITLLEERFPCALASSREFTNVAEETRQQTQSIIGIFEIMRRDAESYDPNNYIRKSFKGTVPDIPDWIPADEQDELRIYSNKKRQEYEQAIEDNFSVINTVVQDKSEMIESMLGPKLDFDLIAELELGLTVLQKYISAYESINIIASNPSQTREEWVNSSSVRDELRAWSAEDSYETESYVDQLKKNVAEWIPKTDGFIHVRAVYNAIGSIDAALDSSVFSGVTPSVENIPEVARIESLKPIHDSYINALATLDANAQRIQSEPALSANAACYSSLLDVRKESLRSEYQAYSKAYVEYWKKAFDNWEPKNRLSAKWPELPNFLARTYIPDHVMAPLNNLYKHTLSAMELLEGVDESAWGELGRYARLSSKDDIERWMNAHQAQYANFASMDGLSAYQAMQSAKATLPSFTDFPKFSFMASLPNDKNLFNLFSVINTRVQAILSLCDGSKFPFLIGAAHTPAFEVKETEDHFEVTYATPQFKLSDLQEIGRRVDSLKENPALYDEWTANSAENKSLDTRLKQIKRFIDFYSTPESKPIAFDVSAIYKSNIINQFQHQPKYLYVDLENEIFISLRDTESYGIKHIMGTADEMRVTYESPGIPMKLVFPGDFGLLAYALTFGTMNEQVLTFNLYLVNHNNPVQVDRDLPIEVRLTFAEPIPTKPEIR